MNLERFFQENEDWRPYADLVAVPPLPEEMMKEFRDINPEVLARSMEFVWEGGGHVTRGAIYVRIRREDRKCGDRWATMLALQAPPGVRTSDTFWAGRKPWHELCTPQYAASIKARLAAQGVSIGANDEYAPELARFPGDPEAILPFNGARSYIKNLCERRGWSAEGAVNYEAREPETDPLADENCPMDKKLVRQKMKLMVQNNPALSRLSRNELKEAAIEKYSPTGH